MGNGLPPKIIAIGVVLAICYAAAPVIAVLLISILLAILLDPGVKALQRIRAPRAVGAALMVLALISGLYLSIVFLYGRAQSFAGELPTYSEGIREQVLRIRQGAEEFEQQVERIVSPQQKQKEEQTVTIVDRSFLSRYLFPGFETAYNFLIFLGLVPFLLFFMLTWQGHFYQSFIDLFEESARADAAKSITDIAAVFRGFLYGNILLGLILSGLSLILFLAVGLPYPYILALLSGFITLIPYLGTVAAIAIPLMFSIGQLRTTGEYMVLLGGMLIIHLVGLNVLLPKLVGSLVEVNPLAATAAILIWGWMWGAMGLILAIPIVAGAKAICDNVAHLKAFGKILGTS